MKMIEFGIIITLAFIGLFELIFILLFILSSIFWIWVIKDCAIKEPPSEDKTDWILFIALTYIFGALIYFIFRRPKRNTSL